MKKFLKITILLFVVGILQACGQTEKEGQAEDRLQVVASFYPMYDFTRNIVGSEGEVELLIPAGTDSHDYEPSAKEIAKLQDADVFVYNNENMELWVPKVAESLNKSDVNIVKATDGLILLPGDEHEHEHDHAEAGHSHELDPHVWLAPSLAIKQVGIIRDQLIKAYPDKKEAFEKNATAYLEKLQKLHEDYEGAFKNAAQKYFVTQHAAFGYLALEYGLTQVPVAGLSPNEEPSATRLAELKEFVEETGIKKIYFEENAKDSIAQTLASETGVSLEVLNPLEGLTKEQMAAGEDYISIMEQNMTALQKTTSAATGNFKEAEKEKTVYNGYFEDKDVQDRSLADWQGEWQSVYPYLKEGTLDQVFEYKAKQSSKMTAAEYKEYYTIGYQTDVKQINIKNDTMEFVLEDNTAEKAEYKYTGKKILTYEAGNRGVRYLFEATNPDAMYRYVQFSDHSIAPTDSEHFHIYFGNESQEALLEEMDNWPTYYPTDLTGLEIAQEMLAH